MNKDTKIGWIGTGVMGEPMCGHLLDAGYGVAVYSRTRSKADALIGRGASWCASPAAVAESCEVVFTMVGSPAEVREVYYAGEGLFSRLRAGSTVIDMSTTAPGLSLEIAATAAAMGANAVDAPVSGGDIGARNASLSIMVGGEAAVVDALMPLFECLGSNIACMGAAGSGQHAKLCNQLVVAGTMIGVCEALVYAERAKLDAAQLVAAIRPGAAGCWTLDKLAPRIIQGDDSPGFMVDHFVKDLGIALQSADALALALPGLRLAHRLYSETQKIGHGQDGTQTLIHAIRALAKDG